MSAVLLSDRLRPQSPAESTATSADARPLRIERLGRVEYAAALDLQERRVAEKLAGAASDTLLLLEHDPVYTLGRGARTEDLCGAPERLGVPVHRVGRGGGVTFHGPGQLVAYPIMSLARHGRDVHRYVRRLEDVLIAVCAGLGVAARRREGLVGVWVEDRKIASIGVGIRRWVTFHGIALNVSTDLTYFEAIVPCAMPAVRVTSLRQEMAAAPSLAAVENLFADEFERVFAAPRGARAATVARASPTP